MKTVKFATRVSEEAYAIMMSIPAKVRGTILSEIIIRAEQNEWLADIKKQKIQEMLQSLGISLDDIVTVINHQPDSQQRQYEEGNHFQEEEYSPDDSQPEESLQEKLDKFVKF